MKWRHAKNNRATFSALLILFLCVMQSGYTLSHATPHQTSNKGQLQLGFYDLLSDRQEDYNAQIMDINGAKLITITQPDDTLFLIKGRMDEMENKDGRIYYNYNPVRYSNPQNSEMIFSFIDFLRHNDVWVYPMTVNKQPLAIGQSGMMFIDSFEN